MGYKAIFYSSRCRISLWKLCVWALATLATKGWGERNIQPKLEEGCVVYQVFCSTYIKEEDFAFFNLIYHFTRQIFTSRPDWPPWSLWFKAAGDQRDITKRMGWWEGYQFNLYSSLISFEYQKKYKWEINIGTIRNANNDPWSATLWPNKLGRVS